MPAGGRGGDGSVVITEFEFVMYLPNRNGWKALAIAGFVAFIILFAIWLANAASVRLIVLHSADGREILINAMQITSLRAARESDHPNKPFTPDVACMVSLSDGKFVTVTETCDTVRDSVDDAAR